MVKNTCSPGLKCGACVCVFRSSTKIFLPTERPQTLIFCKQLVYPIKRILCEYNVKDGKSINKTILNIELQAETSNQNQPVGENKNIFTHTHTIQFFVLINVQFPRPFISVGCVKNYSMCIFVFYFIFLSLFSIWL